MQSLEVETPVRDGDVSPGWNSDAIAQVLRDIDLPYVALVPGASFRGLHDSLVNFLGNRSPQMLVCLHEEHAVAIAHGYAKVTGRPMGAILHSNVGLMHATMAIFNAFCDRMPVVVLGAHGPVDANRRRPWIDWVHTAADLGGLVRNFVKWDNEPASVPAAVEALLRGVIIARTPPYGPVYVCFDTAMQEAALDGALPAVDAARFKPPEAPEPSRAAVKEAVRLLKGAKAPVILAGRIAPSEAAWAERIALAERLGARVLTDWRVGSVFPTAHPLHAGASQYFASGEARRLMQQSDVILSLDWVDLGGTLKAAGPVAAKVIQASCDQYVHNGWSMDHQALAPVDANLLSTPEKAVHALLEELGRTPRHETPPDAREARPRRVAAAGHVTFFDIADALQEAAAGSKVTFSRLPIGWPSDIWDFDDPLSFLGGDGGAGIGSGPGMAVGVALALLGAKRLPVAILGDGDYLMGANALWTAARYRIPLLVLVANNRSFFNDELHQERVAIQRGRPAENRWIGQRLDEPQPDLAALARSLQLEGFGPVRSAEELRSVLNEAVALVRDGRAVVVDIQVEAAYDQDSKGVSTES